MSAKLHHRTPTLTVVDSRGLTVRSVAYWRGDEAEENAQARVTRQAYDRAGHLIEQWDPRQVGETATANLTTRYSFSGKPLRVDSVDAGWRLNLCGDAGQVLYSWDQRGSYWQTTYDEQLRTTRVAQQTGAEARQVVERFTYADSSLKSAARNACGALIRHDDSAGTLLIEGYALCAKPLGQTRHFLTEPAQPDWPTEESDRDGYLEPGAGHRTIWQYDASGETLCQTDAGNHQQHFSYNVAGQLKDVHLLPEGEAQKRIIVNEIVYNAFGQIESQTAGNGVISRARFNLASGRMTSLSATVPGDTLQDLHYTYDAVGNVLRIEDRAQPVQHGNNQRVEANSTFAYDSLYQLTRATGRETAGENSQPHLPASSRAPIDARLLFNFTEHYQYDRSGNLTELRHVRDRNNFTRTFNMAAASNRLVSWLQGEPTSEVAVNVDVHGNQQALYPGQVLTWNARNQLAGITLVEREEADNDVEHYYYDSRGQRARKIQTTYAASVKHTREVRYLPGFELHTRHNERLHVITMQVGRCSVRYLHWVKGRPAGIDGNQLRYSLDDHLGSSSLELDDKALLTSQESYLPYGGTAWAASRSAVEASYRTVRYCAKERDASGLYYYGHRYYAPWLQRWISPDPAGAVDGLNLYCMVGNNPLKFVDHQGLGKVLPTGYIAPSSADVAAQQIVTSANANVATTSKKRSKSTAKAAGSSALGFSKNNLKDLAAHTYGNVYDAASDSVFAIGGFYNLSGPKTGPQDYPGVDKTYDGTGKSNQSYLNFGSYKISDTKKYLDDLAIRYESTETDSRHRIVMSLDVKEQHPELFTKMKDVHKLQEWTREVIEEHIESSRGIIPVRAGGPGTHAEVRALNTIVALFPRREDRERIFSETTLRTSKLVGKSAPEPFVACINCSGIISNTVDVWTGLTRMDYAAYAGQLERANIAAIRERTRRSGN